MWTAIKKKLVHVTASLDNDREKVPESGPTDKTDEDREEVSVEEVDHDLVTESVPDDIMDVDRDQLGIFNFDSVGQYGYPIGPIVEAAIEDDDEDSPMEDDDEDDVTEVETNSDQFWMKTCVICSLTLCVCLTPAEVEAESEAAAAASILEELNNYSEVIVNDCPAAVATTEALETN